MQQTAGALQAQATATAKSARDMAASGMRKSASKVTSKLPGQSTASASGNGAVPQSTGGDGARPFVPVNGSFGEHDLI